MKITHKKVQASTQIKASYVESCDQVTASSDWVEGFTEGVGKYFDLEREAGTAQIYEMEADGDIGYGVLVKYTGKKKRDADSFWGPNALEDAKEFAEYCLKDEIESCSAVTAASSTWDRISGLEEQIAQLEASIEDAKAGGADIEDLLPEYEELDRLKDELRFAWADDEAEYNYALEQQEFNPDGSLKGYGDGISFSTDVTASNIVPNKKIQEGMVFYNDGFTKEVTSVSSDHKTCKVTEDWIAEDTGEPQHREYTYKIVEDKNGEYMYDPEYAKYANVGSDDYSWWARKYASGADNYPWSFDEEEPELEEVDVNAYDKGTLGYAIASYKNDANEGDYYNKVKVIVNGQRVYLGNSLDEAEEKSKEFLSMPIYNYFWHDDYIEFVVDTRDFDDEYTSSTAGDYGPSNPWDAPGMSVKDFI